MAAIALRRRALSLLVVRATSVIELDPGGRAATNASMGAIAGTVRDRAIRRPVSTATVRVEGTGLSALTRDDGRFRLSMVPAGARTLIVQASGFEPLVSEVRVSPQRTATVLLETERIQPVRRAGAAASAAFRRATVLHPQGMSSLPRFAYIGSLIVIAAAPSPAAADWLLTPFAGGTLFDIADTRTRPVFGGSVAWIGPVAGVELDLGDAPTSLESRSGLAIDTSNVFALMGNGVVQFPTASRRIRPYAVGGSA